MFFLGFCIVPSLESCVSDIDNAYIAAEVKLVLQNILGDEETAYFNGNKIFIYELDRQTAYDYATTLYIPPKNLVEKQRFNFADLYQIMRILRGDNGCQWDKAHYIADAQRDAGIVIKSSERDKFIRTD